MSFNNQDEVLEGAAENAVEDRAPDAPQTRIDHAWRAAQDEARSSDAAEAGAPSDIAAAAFVDMVLAELLVCPVWDEDGEPPSAGRAQPKLIPLESGGEALPLFDSEDRLSLYLEKPSAFIALPGREFFLLAAEHELAIAFNPSVAPSEMTFSAASVAAIVELMAAGEEETEVSPDAGMEARAPSDPPGALMSALAARLAASLDLASSGWLFEAVFEKEAPQLVLALVAQPAADDVALDALSAELSRLGGALIADRALNIAVFQEGEPALERIRRVGFGIDAAS